MMPGAFGFFGESVALKENLLKKGTEEFWEFKVPDYIKEAIEWMCEST